MITFVHAFEADMPKKQYPAIYEKAIPAALAVLALLVIALLVVVVLVLTGA